MSRAFNLTLICTLFLCTASAFAEDFTGTYTSNRLAVEIKPDQQGQYSGTIQMGNQQFPLHAQAQNGRLTGTFSNDGHDFPFTATLKGDHLSLVSGTKTYELDRPSMAVNPLDIGGGSATPAPPAAGPAPAPVGAPPMAGAPPTADGPGGYTMIAMAGTGRTLLTTKGDIAVVDKALTAAIADLNTFFDGKIKVDGAYADAKGNHGGGAFFIGRLKGQDIKGSIFCGIGDKGATLTVVYDRPDAPPAEWKALTAALAPPTKTTLFKFPDGTGSLELPDGWKTNNRSVVGGIIIQGPAGQQILLGNGFEIVTPDSQTVQMHNKLNAQARQLGGRQLPFTMCVAPYTGPADALKNLLPQLSHFSELQHGPTSQLDKIIRVTDCQSGFPNGQAAWVYYAWTKGENGRQTACRASAQMETYPVGPGTWALYVTQLAAPDATFDADLPVMLQIANSWKCDDEAIQRVTNNNIRLSNQRFQAFENTMKQKSIDFDKQLADTQRQQVAREKTNADFDEVIRGYRTVEDTATGERRSVDLGNVDNVVDRLNEGDPGRYKQIPLRDE